MARLCGPDQVILPHPPTSCPHTSFQLLRSCARHNSRLMDPSTSKPSTINTNRTATRSTHNSTTLSPNTRRRTGTIKRRILRALPLAPQSAHQVRVAYRHAALFRLCRSVQHFGMLATRSRPPSHWHRVVCVAERMEGVVGRGRQRMSPPFHLSRV